MTEKASILMPCGKLNTQAAQMLLSGVRSAYGEPFVAELETPVSIVREALKTQSEIVVVAVTKQIYLKTKLALLKGLGTKIVVSKILIDRMGEKAPENEKERNLMAAIPSGAKVYPSEDGLQSSFSFAKDGKQLIFFVLDDETFSSTVSAVFGRIPEEKTFGKSVETVIGSGKKFAVAPCGSSQEFMKLLDGFGVSKTVILSDKAEKQEPETEKDFALSAKNAGEWCLADYGVSLSGVLRDEKTDERYIAVFLASSDEAQVAEVYADGDESDSSLLTAAVNKLCLMMEQAVTTEPEKKKGLSLLPILIAAIGIILAVVFSFAVMTAENKNESAETTQTISAVENGDVSVQL